MTLATPLWLWALSLLLLPVLLRLWAGMEGRDAVGLLVSPRLREDLLHGAGKASSGWGRFLLIVAAFACLVLALARPQWGEITQEEFGEGRSVMLAIDTSRSMLADDLAPDRLTRAKLAALDLIEALPGDQIGLMAFAGASFVQVPLTTDRDALTEAIDQLDIYSIARGGTNLGSAIKLASNSFEDAGTEQSALILFTDGEELEGGALEEAESATKSGTTIVCIGVGSSEGSRIPDPEARPPGSSFVKDKDGKVVTSKLDTAALEKIASASDGLFLHLDPKAMNNDLLREALSKLDTAETEGGVRTVPIERFAWPLGAGLVLLVVALLTRVVALGRRSPVPRPTAIVPLLVIGFVASRGSVLAGPASEAYALYQNQEFEAATEQYETAIAEAGGGERAARLQLGLGASAVGTGDLETALDAFGTALLSERDETQETAHFNLGGTLYQMGDERIAPPEPSPDGQTPPTPPSPAAIEQTRNDWLGAIDQYRSALALDPDSTQAAENIEFIEKRLEELEQQQQQEEQQQDQNEGDEGDQGDEDQSGEEEGEEDKAEEEGDEGDQSEEGDGDGEEQEGEGEPEPNEEGAEESEQNGPGDEAGEEENQGTDESGQASDEEGEGEQAEASEAGEDPDAEINEETGYSIEQARRALNAFASEQKNLKRPKRRARARYFKDW